MLIFISGSKLSNCSIVKMIKIVFRIVIKYLY